MTTFRVAERFSADPGGRYYTDGDFSGEEFREEHLLDLVADAIRLDAPVTIDFDGVFGLPPSFVEEAFGGLVRAKPNWSHEQIERYLLLDAPNSPRLKPYVQFAKDAIQKALKSRLG